MEPDLADRLAEHRMLSSLPRNELDWLASHGELRAIAPGQVVTSKDGPGPEGMVVVLSGHITIHVDRGAGRHKVMEWRGGDITGRLPYSRIAAPPGDTMTEEPTEILLIRNADLPEMIHECYELTSMLVHQMIDRARQFTTSDMHDEKMVSLGKLAAGLAHELNNPASALARSAKQLTANVVAAEISARALGARNLSPGQLAAVDAARACALTRPDDGVRTPIEQADREESIADWLDSHGVDSSIADQLAETGVTIEALDPLAEALEGDSLEVALRSIATGCSVQGLAREIERAAFRISELVTAVKGFTFMDQSTASQPVDLGEGLRNTLEMLKAKARAKSVGVNLTIEPELPTIDGFGGELNQVWVNLLDNAIDAVGESGHVEVSAARKEDQVVVRVVDDGPGIPQSIRDRIYDPFFTTKPQGEGTGLGLDITRRLVRRHKGDIDFESRPGRTEFIISLPVSPAMHQGEKA
jgi:signal transduction histidine kinase